jgi:hypothetical protein
MAEVTLHLPDELADRLGSDPDRYILALLQQSLRPAPNLVPEPLPLYGEVLNFLLSQPTPQNILDFQVSDEAQSRLQDLLDKQQNSALDWVERQELDTYENLNHFMFLLKIQAFDRLNSHG